MQTNIPNTDHEAPGISPGRRNHTPGAYLIGIAGGVAVALTGVWLAVAPFAFGYQPDGADWIEATTVGVTTGIGLLVAGLAVTALLVRALRDHLVACGYAKPKQQARPAPSEPAAGRQAQGSKELEDVLVPLAAALLEDLRAEQRTHPVPADGQHDTEAHNQAGTHPNPPAH